jgi:hypothetical protein
VNATPLVNAWIFLNEDQPDGTNYNSSNSSYQRLIQRAIYPSVDILNICFVTILPTGPKTVPPGDGSSYTLSTGDPPPQHPGGLTNQDYMLFTLRDSHRINPRIKMHGHAAIRRSKSDCPDILQPEVSTSGKRRPRCRQPDDLSEDL